MSFVAFFGVYAGLLADFHRALPIESGVVDVFSTRLTTSMQAGFHVHMLAGAWQFLRTLQDSRRMPT